MEQKQVFVRTLSGKTVVVDGPQIDDTLESLENKIRLACAAENEELPLDTRIRFSVAGVPVEELTGESVRLLAEGQPLELNVALIGGKVHGSLARAGKVRAQTPKVEKTEKRKKKRGRAFRRMQYNKRFVNVAVTQGRRRGPNAQQV